MSDYDSGDDLLADVVPDTLATSSKRPLSAGYDGVPDGQAHAGKRAKVGVDDDRFDSLARQLLKEKFGFEDFRHEQRAAIRSILKGESTLVIFPTGAGKSLCYQVNISSWMWFPKLMFLLDTRHRL